MSFPPLVLSNDYKEFLWSLSSLIINPVHSSILWEAKMVILVSTLVLWFSIQNMLFAYLLIKRSKLPVQAKLMVVGFLATLGLQQSHSPLLNWLKCI